MRTRYSEQSWPIPALAALAMLVGGCSSGGPGTSDVRAGARAGIDAGSGSQVATGGATNATTRTTTGEASSAGRTAETTTPAGGEPAQSGTNRGGAGPGGAGRSGEVTGGAATGGRAGAGGGATSGSTNASGGARTGGKSTESLATEMGGTRTGGTTSDTVETASGGARSGGLATGGGGKGGGATGTAGVTTSGLTSGGASGTAGAGGNTAVRLAWTNPLVPQRADPHVLLHSDGNYYLTATAPEYDRIELRRATSLGGLSTAQATVVWRKHASGEMGAHIWAPEIHFIDGAWYIYFTAGRSNDIWAIRLYALKNTSANPLEGTWTELGRITTNWDSFSLDATTFALAGQRYYLWTQKVPNYPGTSILIARMSSPTTLTGAQVVLSSPQLAWETRGVEVNEAPAVLVKNGKVFVTYSASATDQNYCLGLLTADASADLLDPKSWKKSQQPVLQTSTQNSQYGPGHNSFTTTPDGRVDILVYHARKYRDIVGEALKNPDRATRAQHLPFDASGMPVFGVPVADGPYQVDVLP